MSRIGQLVLLLPLIIAAAPVHPGPLPVPPIPPAAAPVHPGRLPVPPVPPGAPPNDGPAPTPDQEDVAPSVPVSDGLKIIPRFIRAPSFHNSYDPSQGFTSGSRWQDDPSEDRRLAPSPGVNLQIPFR